MKDRVTLGITLFEGIGGETRPKDRVTLRITLLCVQHESASCMIGTPNLVFFVMFSDECG